MFGVAVGAVAVTAANYVDPANKFGSVPEGIVAESLVIEILGQVPVFSTDRLEFESEAFLRETIRFGLVLVQECPLGGHAASQGRVLLFRDAACTDAVLADRPFFVKDAIEAVQHGLAHCVGVGVLVTAHYHSGRTHRYHRRTSALIAIVIIEYRGGQPQIRPQEGNIPHTRQDAYQHDPSDPLAGGGGVAAGWCGC